MSPFEIGIILHYSYSSEDHPAMFDGVPIWPTTRDQLKEWGLLEETTMRTGKHPCYRLTERGKAYAQALQRMPLPIARWEIPGMAAL